MLELAIQKTPLTTVLAELVRIVEAHSPAGLLGSILRLDETSAHLRRAVFFHSCGDPMCASSARIAPMTGSMPRACNGRKT